MNAVHAFQFTYKKTNIREKKKHFNNGTYLIFKETFWNLYYYPIDKIQGSKCLKNSPWVSQSEVSEFQIQTL